MSELWPLVLALLIWHCKPELLPCVRWKQMLMLPLFTQRAFVQPSAARTPPRSRVCWAPRPTAARSSRSECRVRDAHQSSTHRPGLLSRLPRLCPLRSRARPLLLLPVPALCHLVTRMSNGPRISCVSFPVLALSRVCPCLSRHGGGSPRSRIVACKWTNNAQVHGQQGRRRAVGRAHQQ